MLLLLALCLAHVSAFASQNWYCPSCGRPNDGSYAFCPIDGTPNPFESSTHTGSSGSTHGGGGVSFSNQPYDIGVPNIGSATYGMDAHNIYVYWVQVQLKTIGYYIKYSDGVDVFDETGVMGSITADAIREFQRDNGLSQTGVINQQLINKISEVQSRRNARPVEVLIGGYYDTLPTLTGDGIRAGSSGSNVRWVQNCLNSLGYYCGSPDGQYGAQTQQQFLRFKQDHGFYAESTTIKLGHLRLMLELYTNSGFDPYSLY